MIDFVEVDELPNFYTGAADDEEECDEWGNALNEEEGWESLEDDYEAQSDSQMGMWS